MLSFSCKKNPLLLARYNWLWNIIQKGDINLYSFSNGDYVGDVNDRKGTSRFIFMMGSRVVS